SPRSTLFLDPGRLTPQVAQEIQLGAAPPAAADDLDAVHHRRVDGEHPLHPHTVRNPAHGEGLVEAAALPGDDHALEDLDALPVAFLDLHVDAHGVARPEI